MTRLKNILLATAIMPGIPLVGCERHSEKTVPASFPLSKVVFRAYTPPIAITSWTQEVWIYVAKNVDVGTLIDLRPFGNLQPGSTAENAAALSGKPVQTRTDDFGTWYRYPTAVGYVEIGCEKATSPTGPRSAETGTPCLWRLYAFTQNPPESVLGTPIMEQLHAAVTIKPKVNWRTIMLFDSDETPILEVWLKDDHIYRMRLYKVLPR